ncbi:hypothetical protein TorRG33x02_087870, partial [Trema orientale]
IIYDKNGLGDLLELLGGVLNWNSERFLDRYSRSGVSSTMRLALKSASSSQPAMAATDLNLGLKILFVHFGLLSVLFGSLGLCFWSSIPIFGLYSFLMVEG